MLRSNQPLDPKPVPAELHFQLVEDQHLQTAHDNINRTITRLDYQ